MFVSTIGFERLLFMKELLIKATHLLHDLVQLHFLSHHKEATKSKGSSVATEEDGFRESEGHPVQMSSSDRLPAMKQQGSTERRILGAFD